ncbi:MAG: hypothetical protein ACLQVL_25130 [Terriglobia bacterium]
MSDEEIPGRASNTFQCRCRVEDEVRSDGETFGCAKACRRLGQQALRLARAGEVGQEPVGLRVAPVERLLMRLLDGLLTGMRMGLLKAPLVPLLAWLIEALLKVPVKRPLKPQLNGLRKELGRLIVANRTAGISDRESVNLRSPSCR